MIRSYRGANASPLARTALNKKWTTKEVAMVSYLAAIWRCRYFWLSLVKNDLRTRYRRSVLGMGWSLLHPICMTAILTAVFSKVFNDKPVSEYAPYVLAGLAAWNYILTVVNHGCHCFFLGESYIRQYPAPLAIYPLRTALGGTVHFLLALLVVVLFSWKLNGFQGASALASLVPTILLLFVFAWSAAVLAGVANVYFQDTQHLTEVGFQMLFYATPIIYDDELFNKLLQSYKLGWFLNMNPLVPLLKLVRQPILHGNAPSWENFMVAAMIVLVTLAAAGWTLSRLQRRLIFHL
jgi:ABC-type polysaccharide/polyol phosphate export permease